MKTDQKKKKRFQLNPVNQRRWRSFKAHRRGFWSLWIFLALFLASLFAEFIANDKPVLVYYSAKLYLPILKSYPETTFGGEFQTEADYRDEFVLELINEKGWMVWPPIRFSYDTVNLRLKVPAPASNQAARLTVPIPPGSAGAAGIPSTNERLTATRSNVTSRIRPNSVRLFLEYILKPLFPTAITSKSAPIVQ